MDFVLLKVLIDLLFEVFVSPFGEGECGQGRIALVAARKRRNVLGVSFCEMPKASILLSLRLWCQRKSRKRRCKTSRLQRGEAFLKVLVTPHPSAIRLTPSPTGEGFVVSENRLFILSFFIVGADKFGLNQAISPTSPSPVGEGESR